MVLGFEIIIVTKELTIPQLPKRTRRQVGVHLSTPPRWVFQQTDIRVLELSRYQDTERKDVFAKTHLGDVEEVQETFGEDG